MNTLIEKEKDVIAFANEVIDFRMNIIKACKAKGITPPTDEQISAYINDYGLHFDDFMADYIEHEGMFRFSNYNPIETKTLKATLKLSDARLVELWNTFIEESMCYGEDSYIYDITNGDDIKFLFEHMTAEEFKKICQLAKEKNTNYVQWFALNDGNMSAKTDIKGIISAYWGDIFKRIMLYPYAYEIKLVERGFCTYFDDVFFPIIAEEIGYKIDVNKGTITEINKS